MSKLEVGSVVRLKSGSPKMVALRETGNGWDLMFFYDETHGPVEPKMLTSVPEACLVLVADAPTLGEVMTGSRPSQVMHYGSVTSQG